MRTVVLGQRPGWLEEFLARRRELGHDLLDELWEGDYHVAPAPASSHGLVGKRLSRLLEDAAQAAGLVESWAFNLGEPDNYRVPDAGYHRQEPRGTWVPTAVVVVEVLSPDDETFEKFGFYAARGVDEILVADPATRTVRLFERVGTAYDETARSVLLDVTAVELTAGVEWPG